ncbi:hypothetical protein [Methanosphaera sp. BMS]|uniref:hypothetical protein n=1 Tax=Methanosphaera sp. BMS TaxID=1789762 RepID=UPI000DC1C49B|nr:hypothetical protein [Methanosphaera sp. BMS]AWX32269.1 hypothetical protein AW729_03735 [Methanosphaera sp. BMS]
MNRKLKYSSIFLLFTLLLILAGGIAAATDVDNNDNTDLSDNIQTQTVGDDASSIPQPTDNNMETKTIKEVDDTYTYTTTASEAKELAKDEKNLKGRDYAGTLTLNPTSARVGDNITASLNSRYIMSRISSSYGITIDGSTIVSGSITPSSQTVTMTFTLPECSPGDHTIKMNVAYSSINAVGSATLTVLSSAVDTKITEVTGVTDEIGNTVIPVTVTDTNGNSINGSSTLTIKDADTVLLESYPIEDGVANVSVPTTRVGDYDLTILFNGNVFFNPSNTTIPVSVSKAATTLTVDQYDEGIYEVINALNNTVLTGTLIQTSNSKVLGNKEIIVSVDGTDYTVTTDNEGKFVYKYDVVQIEENIPISIKFAGDELYQASQEYSGTFDIEALETNIILDEDPLSEVNETTTISGKLTDNYNNPIPNTDVNLEITGVNDIVTVTTDSEGKFSYDVIYNDVLEVTVEASLANAVLYEAEPATMTFNVVVGPKRTNLTIETGSGSGNNINIVDVTPYFNEVITNGTLIDIFNEPVAGATIKILINNEDYSQTTDSEGKFTLVYNATQGLTTYNISVEFEGNDAYKPAGEVYTGTFKTEAFDITVTVDENFPEEILIGDEVTITGTATLQNQTLKNNPIVLTIDGTKYTTSTDEEGKYSYTYTVARNGTIPITANATFANADVKLGQTSFFVAKPAVNIDLDEVADTKVYSDITLNGRIYIAQNDTAIEDSLILKINGNDMNLASDEEGLFTYTFTPTQAGIYDILISYGNIKYAVNNATAQVTAIQRQAQLVNDKQPISVKVNDFYTISGSLVDEDNNPIANAEVIFIINDETSTNNTDADGRYVYNYQTSNVADNNLYEVSYSGDDNYASAKNYVGSFFDVEATTADISIYAMDTSIAIPISITGTVSDKNNNLLSNVNVVIIIKNNEIQTTTNDVGMYGVEYTPTKVGQTTVTATIKDKNYLEQSISTTINVEKVTTTTTIETVRANGDYESNLTATVMDSNNNVVPSGKVVFKINGKTVKDENGKVIYTKISNGQAILPYTFTQDDIDNNVSISAAFSGSSNYDSSSSQKANILLDNQHESTVTTSDITAKAGDLVTFTAKVTDYGENINTGKVVFKINGKTIKDENNKVIYSPVENGIASCEYTIPETMKAKTYNITAVFTASQYNRTEANAQLTVEATENNGTNPTGTVHIITNDNVDSYMTKNGLSDLVSAGDTLDIQGTIDKTHSLVINKPINVISSTRDAVINLHTKAGSLMGEDPGNCFTVNKAGAGSNISSLYLTNTECWIFNTHDVTLHNMTMHVKDAQVGSGVGQTAVRYSERIIIDSCFIYTENNGGSTSMALTACKDILIKNTTIQGVYGSGQVGNILYIGNRYNMGDKPSDFTVGVDTNITLMDSTIMGECIGAITVAVYNNLTASSNCNFINNTFDTTGSYGTLISGPNAYIEGNKMYGTSGISVGANSIACGNVFYGSGKITLAGNTTIYDNTLGTLNLSAKANLYNNTIASVIMNSNMELSNNIVTGDVTLTRAAISNVIISNNTIYGNIVSTGTNTVRKNTNNLIANNTIGGGISLSVTDTHRIEGNTINGTVTIANTATNTVVNNNTIITANQYAVTTAIASTTITNNFLTSNNNQLFGNAAVSDSSRKATIANNTPNDAYYTHVTFDEAGGMIGETANIVISVTNNQGANTDGQIYLKVNDEVLTDENGNTLIYEVTNNQAVITDIIIPVEWLKSDTILTAVYTNNNNYIVTESTTMNIDKYEATVEITTEELTVNTGSSITLTAKVTDNNGELINGQLAFKLDGNTLENNDETLIFVDVIDGIATLDYTIPSDMTAGSYTLTAVFENTYYQRCDDVKTLIIE